MNYTIFWDIDDVLNNFMEEWFKYYVDYTMVGINYCDIVQNPPHNILGISLEEYYESIDNFRLNHYFSLKPNLEVLNWFKKYGHQNHHIALTAVPLGFEHLSANWLFKHFGEWIRGFHFVPSREENEGTIRAKNKAEVIQRYGYNSILIEDSTNNYQQAKDLKIRSFLVKQNWNEGEPLSSVLDSLKFKV